jgi:hypothetical protein
MAKVASYWEEQRFLALLGMGANPQGWRVL